LDAIVISLAFYFFSSLMRPEAVPQYYGPLTPRSDLLFSVQQREKSRRLEIGDSCTMFKFTGLEGGHLFDIFADSFLTIELIEGQVKVSTTIRDQSGDVVAELIRNEWKVAPHPGSWDLNYTKDALEVKDARNSIVLQVRALPDRIQLQGEWWDNTGHGIRLVKNDNSLPRGGSILRLNRVNNLNPPPHIEPIFEYPSDTHLGKMKIPATASRPACTV